MKYRCSKKMFTRGAKTIRIIGHPDNRRPDKWSSNYMLKMKEQFIRRTNALVFIGLELVWFL